MISQITAIVSVIIAIISLIISIRVYKRDTPKVHIEILNPEIDCLFGNVAFSDSEQHQRRISGMRIRLRNPSSANIEVQSIALQIKNDLYQLIPNDLDFWDEVTFITTDDSGQDIDCNFSIPYSTEGIHVPCVISGFHFLEGYVLFNNFPAKVKEKVSAEIIVHTAVGIVKKHIKLREYYRSFEKEEQKEIDQYFNSLEDKK